MHNVSVIWVLVRVSGKPDRVLLNAGTRPEPTLNPIGYYLILVPDPNLIFQVGSGRVFEFDYLCPYLNRRLQVIEEERSEQYLGSRSKSYMLLNDLQLFFYSSRLLTSAYRGSFSRISLLWYVPWFQPRCCLTRSARASTSSLNSYLETLLVNLLRAFQTC